MKRAAAGLLALAVLLAGWAFWWEPSSLVTRATTVSLPAWPRALDGLRIVQLSDLHVGAHWSGLPKLREIVARANAAQPDLIVLTGDYLINGILGGAPVTPEDIAHELGALRARLGVYGVLGNHDIWVDGWRTTTAFRAAGIRMLDDEAVAIEGRGTRFWLAGIGDYNETRHDWRRALAPVPAGDAVLAITHNPDLFPELPASVALLMAGHTHGGQVRLPLLGTPVVPSRYASRYAAGLIAEDGRRLFVSPGLGTSILPVRFRVPPEISLLTLRAAGAAPLPSPLP